MIKFTHYDVQNEERETYTHLIAKDMNIWRMSKMLKEIYFDQVDGDLNLN